MLPELTIGQAALLSALGLSVGAIGATVGVGGGFLMVPALLIIFPDAAPSVVTSISLTAIVLNGASATVGYRRRRQQDGRTGLILTGGTVPAAVLAALVTRVIDRGAFDIAFGATLIFVAGYLAWRGHGMPSSITPSDRGRPRRLIAPGGVVYEYRVQERHAFAVGAASGSLALFGLGGGIVNVPLMMLVLRIPSVVAVATSQLPLMLGAAAAVAVHLVFSIGEPDQWLRALIVGGGTVAGAQVGVRLGSRFGGRGVLLLIAGALFSAGIRQLVSGLG